MTLNVRPLEPDRLTTIPPYRHTAVPPTFHFMKRVLVVVGGVLALVLVLLLVLPMLFGDQIAQRVKTAVNQNVNARVDWSHVGLSFFRHFPNLTLTLDDLTAVGVDRFQSDTLAAVRHLRVSLSLPSVLSNVMGGSGPVVVRGVELDQPRLSLIALEDGTANWNISRQAPVTSHQSKAMEVSLRRFEIKGADVAFDNRRAKLKATLASLISNRRRLTSIALDSRLATRDWRLMSQLAVPSSSAMSESLG